MQGVQDTMQNLNLGQCGKLLKDIILLTYIRLHWLNLYHMKSA